MKMDGVTITDPIVGELDVDGGEADRDKLNHDNDDGEAVGLARKRSLRLTLDSSSEEESVSIGRPDNLNTINHANESDTVFDVLKKKPNSLFSLKRGSPIADEHISEDDQLFIAEPFDRMEQARQGNDSPKSHTSGSGDELLDKLIAKNAMSRPSLSSSSDSEGIVSFTRKKKFSKSSKTQEKNESGKNIEDPNSEPKLLDFTSWKSKLGKGLISDESEPEEDLGEIKMNISKKFRAKPERTKKTPKPKKEDLMELHSTSQRLLRNAQVSLPYHKPKCHTLDDFLKRKRVALPDSVNTKRGPRLSGKDLELVAQQFKERENEVEQFYKSESDSDIEQPIAEPPRCADLNLRSPMPQTQTLSDHIKDTDFSLGESTAIHYPISQLLLQDDTEKQVEEVPETTPVQELRVEETCEDEQTASCVERSEAETHQQESDIEKKFNTVVEMDISKSQIDSESVKTNEKGSEITSENLLDNVVSQTVTEAACVHDPSIESEDSALDKELLSDLLSRNKEVKSDILSREKEVKPDLVMLKLSALKQAKNLTPHLSGSPGHLVCLDEDEKVAPAYEKLLSRFMKHSRSKSPSKEKKPAQLSIVKRVVDANGKVQLEREIIELKVEEKKGQLTPCLSQLKVALRSKIISKREASRQKHLDEFRMDNEEDGEDKEEMEEDILDDETSESEGEEEEEFEEDDIDIKKKRRKKSALIDEEAEESGDEADEESENDSDRDQRADSASEDESGNKDGSFALQNSLIPPNKPLLVKNVSGNAEFNKSMEELGFLTPHPFEPTQLAKRCLSPPPEDTLKISSQDFNANTSQNASQIDELLGLCSGGFGSGIQEISLHYSQTENISQMCSGEFKSQMSLREESQEVFASLPIPSQPVSPHIPRSASYSRIVLTEAVKSLEDDWSEDEADKKAEKSEKVTLTFESIPAPDLESDEEEGLVKKHKRKRRLQFSEDESDAGEAQELVSDMGDMEDRFNDDEEKDYDSDENELPSKKVAKGLLYNGKLRKDFLENEAELSGSELGSEDEDERGLDLLEEEEGDKDEIDEDELQEQVGRAHLKTLLDDDQREVRLLKEILLEDGDLHTDGKARERKFRWRNMDDGWENTPDGRDQQDDGEDEEGEEWRKTRFERERWIQENEKKKTNVEAEEEEVLEMRSDSSVLKLSKTNLKRSWIGIAQPAVEKNSVSKTQDKEKATNLLLTSPDAKQKLLLTHKRGSFLSRGANLLTKMAGSGKGPQAVSFGPSNSKNFTFSAVKVDEKEKAKPEVHRASVPPPAKKVKVDRNLNLEEMSKTVSVFKHLN